MSIKFLAFSDLVGNPQVLNKILKLDLKNYDFALCLGDLASTKLLMKVGKKRALSGVKRTRKIVDPKEYYLKNFPEVIKQLEIVKAFLKKLKEKLPIYGIWGNADLTPFIEKTKIDRYIKSIHKNPIKINKDTFLLGYDGRPLYVDEIKNPKGQDFIGISLKKGMKLCHAFNEEQIQKDLSKIFKNLIGKKVILATHVPPFGILDKVYSKFTSWAVKTYGESAKRGNIGSKGLIKIDEKYKPLLHIFGHIHEAKGKKIINRTTFINVGTMENGEFVKAEILNNKLQVKFVKV